MASALLVVGGALSAGAVDTGPTGGSGRSGDGTAAAKVPTAISVSCKQDLVYTGQHLNPCTATVTAADGFSTTVPVSYQDDDVHAGHGVCERRVRGERQYPAAVTAHPTTFVIAQAVPSVDAAAR